MMRRDSNGLSAKLLSEWNYDKNDCDPKMLSAGSHKKVWWVCLKGHQWQAVIYSRSSGKGCPYCSNKKIERSNSFGEKYKNLMKEWHPDNIEDPYELSPMSNKKVKWICNINRKHVWETAIYHRVGNGRGCPYCSGHIVLPEDSFAELNQHLMKYWSHRNKLNPYEISPVSGKVVEWVCDNNPQHYWKTRVADIVRGTRCPYCSNKKADISNSFGSLFPNLLEEWDYTKNKLDPFSIVYGSIKKVWWVCRNNKNHKWKAMVRERTCNGTGCPRCCHNVSKSCREWLDEMLIYNREKVIYIDGKKYVVDGFDIETNTVFEYFGSFWHGNPNVYSPDDINNVNKKTFGELFKKTKDRVKNFLKDGYDICFTWGE